MATDEVNTPDGTGVASQGDVSEDQNLGVTDPADTTVTGAEGGDASADGKDAEGNDDSAGEAGKAPESYSDFNLPEGMQADEQMLDKAQEVFKEIGLSQDQAQMVVDLYGQRMQEMEQGQIEAFGQQVADWEDAAKADKEFGGDKFDQNLGVAKLGMEKLGTPELKDFLEKSGAGSHPEVLRFFYRVGNLVKEDNPGGGEAPAEKADRVSVLYPDL